MNYKSKKLASAHIGRKLGAALSTVALVAPTAMAAVPQVALAADWVAPVKSATLSTATLTLTDSTDTSGGGSANTAAITLPNTNGTLALSTLTLTMTPKKGYAYDQAALASLGEITAEGTKLKIDLATSSITTTADLSSADASATLTGKDAGSAKADSATTAVSEAAYADHTVGTSFDGAEYYQSGANIVVVPDGTHSLTGAKYSVGGSDMGTIPSAGIPVSAVTGDVTVTLATKTSISSSVIIKYDDADDTKQQPVNVESDGTYIVPSSVSKSGYTLRGFAKSAADRDSETISVKVRTTATGETVFDATDVQTAGGNDLATLYAVWGRDYTISYDANGGSGAPESQSTYVGSGVTVKTGTPSGTVEGSTFQNWTVEYAGKTYVVSGTSASAQLKDTDGVPGTENGSNITVEYIGRKTGAVKLVAQWSVNYAIAYDRNGATAGSFANTAATTGTNAAIKGKAGTSPDVGMAYDGHYFLGWNTRPDGSGTAVAAGTTTDDVQDALDALAAASSNKVVTLYAQWIESTAEKPVVEYDTNTDSVDLAGTAPAKPSSTTITLSDTPSVSLESLTYTKGDFVFAGWNTAKDGSGEHFASGSLTGQELNNLIDAAVNAPEVSGTPTLRLYAEWKPVYTIALDGNANYNGTSLTSSGTVSNSQAGANTKAILSGKEKLAAVSYSRTDGYVLSGFNTKQDGSGVTVAKEGVLTSELAAAAKVSVDDNVTKTITLYAQWAPAGTKYTVAFSPNGGAGTMTAQAVEVGGTATLKANTLTRDNYEFVCWNTQANGKGTDIADGASQALLDAEGAKLNGGTMTLYAKWAKKYTVRFDAGNDPATVTTRTPDATGDTADQKAVEGKAASLAACGYKKAGYTFSGWYYGGKKVTSTSDLDAAASAGMIIHVTAHWVEGKEEPEPEKPEVKAGWYKDADGDYHYATSVVDGERVDAKGWSRGGTTKYYYFFDLTTGKMKKNEWVKSGAYWYHFGPRGAMESNKDIAYKGTVYHLNARGAAVKKA